VGDGVDSRAHLFYMFDENSGGLLGGSGNARHAHVPVAYSALDESPGGLLGKVSDSGNSHAHLFYMFDDAPNGLLGSGGVDCHGVTVDAEDAEGGMQNMVGGTTGVDSSDSVLPVAGIDGCRMMAANEGPGTALMALSCEGAGSLSGIISNGSDNDSLCSPSSVKSGCAKDAMVSNAVENRDFDSLLKEFLALPEPKRHELLNAMCMLAVNENTTRCAPLRNCTSCGAEFALSNASAVHQIPMPNLVA